MRELFRTMNTRSIIDTVRGQMDSTSSATLDQALAGRSLNDRQRQILRDGHEQVMVLISQTLDWNAVEPVMVEVYRDHFTQQEIDQMLQFYRSPTGQMVIAKLPATTQEMMQKMQARMQSLAPRTVELRKEPQRSGARRTSRRLPKSRRRLRLPALTDNSGQIAAPQYRRQRT